MKIPEPLWATVFAAWGVILAIVCLHYGSTPETTTVLIIASNLISGALGALKTSSGSISTVSTPGQTIQSSTGDSTIVPAPVVNSVSSLATAPVKRDSGIL